MLSVLLLPVAFAYGVAAAVRRGLYRTGWLARTRVAPLVVIVGNITVGGTGKTPLTIALAKRLSAHAIGVGVVCRSYGAAAKHPAAVSPEGDPAEHGDEAVLIAREIDSPVWSGPDRAATAQALARAHPECSVLLVDDGLQHYALERDVEIAVVDATRGLGNGRLLPAGPLREPAWRLAGVDAIVFNGCRPVTLPGPAPRFSMTLAGETFETICGERRLASAAELARLRLVAIAGTGHPERFFEHLAALGLQFEAHAFPDHHRYDAAELAFPNADAILMTGKDAIKCRRFGDPRYWQLPVTAHVPDALVELIRARAMQRPPRPAREQAQQPPE